MSRSFVPAPPRDPDEPKHTHMAGVEAGCPVPAVVACPGCQWMATRAAEYYEAHPSEMPDWLAAARSVRAVGNGS